MLFFGKQLEDITQSDLQNLIGQEREVKSLEFKRDLPGNDYESKREFLADVSSFANASGGYIIFGIDEANGIASNLTGFDATDIDSEKLALESSLRDNIKPRLPIVNFQEVVIGASKYVLIIEIPKSWSSPHVVQFRKHWRFYSRNSAGKYPLDVDEVRNAFIASETLRERISDFRSARLASIIANETPVTLTHHAKMVLHAIPLSAFTRTDHLPIKQIGSDWDIKRRLGHSHRHNFDGYLGYNVNPNDSNYGTYTQIFRNGILEYVDTRILHIAREHKKIPSTAFEKYILEAMENFLWLYSKFDSVEPPVIISFSMLGVKGLYMAVSRNRMMFLDDEHIQPIDRDNLIVPEAFLEDFSKPPHTILQPFFDAIWNACGWAGSLNYDKDGNWREHQ